MACRPSWRASLYLDFINLFPMLLRMVATG